MTRSAASTWLPAVSVLPAGAWIHAHAHALRLCIVLCASQVLSFGVTREQTPETISYSNTVTCFVCLAVCRARSVHSRFSSFSTWRPLTYFYHRHQYQTVCGSVGNRRGIDSCLALSERFPMALASLARLCPPFSGWLDLI